MSAIFPSQYSTLSATALNDFLQATYGLKNMQCRLLIRNVSDTYLLIGEDEKYIFKIYRDNHRSLEEIKGEIALLNLLKEMGAAVSYPLKDLSGKQIQQFNAAEGVRNGVMLSYAQGDVVLDMNDAQLQLLGREMARLHNITANLVLPYKRKCYTVETTLLEPIKVIEPAFKNLKSEYEYLKSATEAVVAALQKMDFSRFSYGYCHYDFLPKNFHFAGDEALTFFDFDFAGEGYLINDIASFFIHYFLENISGKISVDLAKQRFQAFLESYRTVRAVTDEELNAIKYVGFGFWMFYFRFHFEQYDDWSNLFFNDRFIKGRVGLLKQWMEWDF